MTLASPAAFAPAGGSALASARLRRGLAACAWAILLICAGCGYAPGPTFHEGVRTINVPAFENRSFHQGIEFDITEAITKEIEVRTPYKAAHPNTADTVLLGVIRRVDESLASRRRSGGAAQDVELRATVDLEWKDQRSGETIASRKGMTVSARYIPARPISETQSTARYELSAAIAERTVEMLRGGW